MIRIEITCDHSVEPRARDAKHPCESNRGRSLFTAEIGTMSEANAAVVRVVDENGWSRMLIPRLGRRMGHVCPPCRRRHNGEI